MLVQESHPSPLPLPPLVGEMAKEFNKKLESISAMMNSEHLNIKGAIDMEAAYLEDEQIPENLDDETVWEQVTQAQKLELHNLEKVHHTTTRREKLMSIKAQIAEKRREAYMRD